MKPILLGLLAFILATPVLATNQPGDERILAAREALRSGDRLQLEQLAAVSDPRHPLDHYVQYWLLLNRLARPDPIPSAELAAWIASHPDTVPAERLRAQWLRRLATDESWNDYLALFGQHPNPDEELRCLAQQARLQLGDTAVLDEVVAAWQDKITHHPACDSAQRVAVAHGRISEDELWERFHHQIDTRAPQRARVTLSWLGGDVQALDRLLAKPEDYYERLPDDFAATRAGRELALAALVRIARHNNAPLAYARLLRHEERFSPTQRAWMYAVLGQMGALSRLPQANDWYQRAGNVAMSPVQRSWRVRAALRAHDWPLVEQSIDQLQASEQGRPEWIYWRARARAAQGDSQSARQLYQQIAQGHDYFAMLATEELGQPLSIPRQRDEIPSATQARAASDPGLRKALAFYRIGLPVEAYREWIQALRGKDREFLLATAHIALQHDLLDRAISTAEMADPGTNFELRFLTPYLDLIRPQALSQQLDLAWIYGLMRQESRFSAPAMSSAGARGLMQVMPETGRLVARRIGLQGYHPRMLNDPQTNVLLGTSYLRMILSDLDEHPVLASAGYNAGPARAQRWRGDEALEGAIYVATIPIDETRDYVQKVLANKVIYAALFEDRPQSLKAHLGVIPPATQVAASAQR